MTKLIVTPIDPSAPGSYRQRSALLRLIARLQTADKEQDGAAALTLMAEVEEMVLKHLETDDGSPLEPLLDDLSADQFDLLLGGILGAPNVPNASSAP